MKTVTIRTRLIGVIGFLSLLLLGIGAFGIYGMAKLDRSLETVYEDRVVPLKQLSDINSMMMENIRHLQLAGMHDPRLPEHTLHDHPLAVHHDKVAANIAEITKLWGDYMATSPHSRREKARRGVHRPPHDLRPAGAAAGD